MKSVIDFLNSLCDQDWGWFPYKFLKPPKDVRIGLKYQLKMAAFYGPTFGAVIGVLILRGQLLSPRAWIALLVFMATFSVLFFVGWGTVFGLAWNHRAKRLRAQATDDNLV